MCRNLASLRTSINPAVDSSLIWYDKVAAKDRKVTAEIFAGCLVGTSDVSQNFVAARVRQSFGYAMKLL
jgi:hypothetical protein